MPHLHPQVPRATTSATPRAPEHQLPALHAETASQVYAGGYGYAHTEMGRSWLVRLRYRIPALVRYNEVLKTWIEGTAASSWRAYELVWRTGDWSLARIRISIYDPPPTGLPIPRI
jgi:hypothetical protein